ncbi:hypothetical protein KY349_01155 [Candidatus Woesearchaeota archaeon]|nr:hypothetical protein [Candidatus Woesearchaeota archaeon]
MKKTEKSYAGWYFLGIVIVIYAAVALFSIDTLMKSLVFFWQIIKKVFWVFLLVFALLVVINYFIKPKTIVKHLGKKAGAKGWLIALISGIISTGPIYLWYPLLNEMQKHGVRNGYVATFLYNRAIKPALLPLFIFYFGIAYTVVLTVVMLFASILQGYVVEKIVEGGKR